MGAIVVRRLVGLVAVMLAVSVATYVAFDVLPQGDPAQRLAGRSASPTLVRAVRHEWGLDRGPVTQYATLLRRAFAGRLVSYETGLEVHGELWRRLPRTIWLAVGGVGLGVVASIGLALLSVGRGRAGPPVTAAALLGVSVPVFWLGALLAYLIGFKAGVLPNGGYVPLTESPWQWLRHLILPWLTVAAVSASAYVLLARARLEDALGEPFSRTAVAKGLPRGAMLRGALRASLAPLVALWGLDLAAVMTGAAILVEAVFDLGGVGQYAAEAMDHLDAPAVMGVTLLAALLVVVVNAVIDVAQAALDPRQR